MSKQALSKNEQNLAKEARPRAAALRLVVEAHEGVAHRLLVLDEFLKANSNDPVCSYARELLAETYFVLTGHRLHPSEH